MARSMILISKDKAACLVGSKGELQECLARQGAGYVGELALLETGAKLYTLFRGAVRRYAISGYACDGSDVAKIMEKLAAGHGPLTKA